MTGRPPRSPTSATPAVIIGTAAKWATVPTAPGRGRSSTRRTRCARTCCCASPGGSSGRCSSATPASSTRSRSSDTDRWAGLSWDPMQSAVAVLLRAQPGPAGAPAAGVLAAAGLGRAGGLARRSTRSPASPGTEPATARRALTFRTAGSAAPTWTRPWTRPPPPAGRCTSCRPRHYPRTDAEAVQAVRRPGRPAAGPRRGRDVASAAPTAGR